MSEAAGLGPGTVVGGDYRVVRRMAAGGMGAVYEAEQVSTGRVRALKVMLPQLVSDAKSRERFAAEARIAARIQSQHVVEVIAAGVDPGLGLPWIAMELLRGETLDVKLERDGPMPLPIVMELLGQLGHGLGEAHQLGIIHRDLKPENLFLAESRTQGGRQVLKILDFGIASAIAEGRGAATVTSAIGTPFWMAPEQANTGQQLTPATDVWPLGLIAYAMLTGKHYWRSANHTEVNLQAVLAEVMVLELEPASMRAREVGRTLPDGFDAWFAGCVAREPSHRYPNAQAAIAALRPVADRIGMAATLQVAAFEPSHSSWAQTPPSTQGSSAQSWHGHGTPQNAWAQGGAQASAHAWPQPSAQPQAPWNDPSQAAQGWVQTAPPWTEGSLHSKGAQPSQHASQQGFPPQASQHGSQSQGSQHGAWQPPATTPRTVAWQVGSGTSQAQPAQVTPQPWQVDASQAQGASPWQQPSAAVPWPAGSAAEFETPKKSRLGLVIGIASVVLLLALAGGGTGFYLFWWRDRNVPAALREACDGTDRCVRRARACYDDHADAEACRELAESFRTGAGATQSDAWARDLHQRACDEGDATGCLRRGELHEAAATEADRASARTLYERACNGGVARACGALGLMLDRARGGARDLTRAQVLYMQACRDGDDLSCSYLGYLYDSRRASDRDFVRAREVLEGACQRGVPGGCMGMAVLYEDGLGLARDYVQALAMYQRACDGGSVAGCVGVGYIFDAGLGVPRDFPVAVRHYERACDAGDSVGCWSLGYLYERGTGVARDYERALALYQRACDAQDTLGCAALGHMYHRGLGVEADSVRARQIYEPGCDGQDFGTCSALAYLYMEGFGVERDPNRARELYQRACERGEGGACRELGYMYQNGRDVPRDYNRAREYFERACDGNETAGCGSLGYLYDRGLGVAAHPALAARHYQTGCDGVDGWACTMLGNLISEGRGVPRDGARAFGLYQRGCDSGDAQGCTRLGVSFRRGQGVAVDPLRAVQSFQLGCERGDGEGCTGWASMLESGEGVPQDYVQARSVYRMACDRGSAVGCNNLGFLHHQGRGGVRDIVQARALYHQACAAGNTTACENERVALSEQ